MSVIEVIATKRDGGEIDAEALRSLVLGYARGELPDYQMSAFLMAGRIRGFSRREAVALTTAMVDSGARIDLSALPGPTVDKHSTGGVGDGTTLVVAPLAAALGMQVLKLSGRGLGHTGGTLDKLDAIPGMRTELSIDELVSQVGGIGLAVGAQTADLDPADRRMYGLRDVTATVDSPALIASSIMSKKLAGGADHILLDVKTGSGAFLHDPADASDLAELCVGIGRDAGRRTAALITDMSQPLGEAIGNAIEVSEAVQVLRGERPGRLSELCLTLTGQLAALAGIAADPTHGRELARRALEAGEGLERFRAFVAAQGGDPGIVDDLSRLPRAPLRREIGSAGGGYLNAIDAAAIGRAAASLGAGREHLNDEIDPAVGIVMRVALGDELAPGDPLVTVLARDDGSAQRAGRLVLDALTIEPRRADPPPLVRHVIAPDDTERSP